MDFNLIYTHVSELGTDFVGGTENVMEELSLETIGGWFWDHQPSFPEVQKYIFLRNLYKYIFKYIWICIYILEHLEI